MADLNDNISASAVPGQDREKKKSALSKNIFGGGKYPSKKSINLMIVERHTRKNLKAVALFAVFLVCLAVFVKFMVIDQLDDITRRKQMYDSQADTLRQLAALNADYDEITAEYAHFGDGSLTDDEQELQDRLEMLDVIEKELIDRDMAVNLTISGNTASLTINSEKLRGVSDIVARLENYDNVEYVTVTRSVTSDVTRSSTSSVPVQTQTESSVVSQAETSENSEENVSSAAIPSQTEEETDAESSAETVYVSRVVSEGIPMVDPGVNVGDTVDEEGVVVPGRTVSYYEGEMAGSGRETEIYTEYITETATEADEAVSQANVSDAGDPARSEIQTEPEVQTEPETEPVTELVTTQTSQQMVVTTLTIYFKDNSAMETESESELTEEGGSFMEPEAVSEAPQQETVAEATKKSGG